MMMCKAKIFFWHEILPEIRNSLEVDVILEWFISYVHEIESK